MWMDCQFEDGSYKRSGRNARAKSLDGAVKEAKEMFGRYGVTSGQVMLCEHPYVVGTFYGYVVKQDAASEPVFEPAEEQPF